MFRGAPRDDSLSAAILPERLLRKCVGIDNASLAAVAESFGWLQDGRAIVPPVAHLEAASGGAVDIKTAYVAGVGRFAVKIATGFPDNAKRGLATGSGMMVVFSSETGFCEAILLDNGYLTDLRTGLAGAVAAQHFALRNVETVGILGTGVQARYQLRSLALVRKPGRVLVWGRSPDRLRSCLEELREAIPVHVEAAATAEQLVRESDLIVTVTASRSPLVRSTWLHAGQHITAVGADFPGKQELEPAVLRRADRLFCDSLAQCERLGEFQHWPGPEGITAVEIGAVVRGDGPGRVTDQEITVCDLTGVGVQDTAIADLACTVARSRFPEFFPD